MTMTTSKPVSELARKLAEELQSTTKFSRGDTALVAGMIAEGLALTRKQTIEECAQAISELPTFHKHGEYNSLEMRSMAAAAIREMEVKA